MKNGGWVHTATGTWHCWCVGWLGALARAAVVWPWQGPALGLCAVCVAVWVGLFGGLAVTWIDGCAMTLFQTLFSALDRALGGCSCLHTRGGQPSTNEHTSPASILAWPRLPNVMLCGVSMCRIFTFRDPFQTCVPRRRGYSVDWAGESSMHCGRCT